MLLAAAIFASEVDYVGSNSLLVTTFGDGHQVAISGIDGWMRINPAFVIPPVSTPSSLHYNSRFNTHFNDVVRANQLRSTKNMGDISSLFASSSSSSSDYDNSNLNDVQQLSSEEDAIRILRTSPRHNHDNKACHTAFDVLYLMSHYSITTLTLFSTSTEDFTPSSISNLSKDELSSIIETIVNNVSPNIAAAALRRLVSPPFLPISFQGTDKYRKERKQMDKRISKIEQNVYDQLMHQILNKMSYTMKSQMSVLSKTSTISQYDDPKLLPQCETLIIPPTTSSTNSVLNWYALADLLYSLSNLSNVLVNHDERNNIIKGHLLTSISPTEQNSIMQLFQNVVQYLSWNDRITSSFVRCIGSRRIIRDVLQSILGMQNVQRKMYYQQESDMEEEDVYSDAETLTSSQLNSCDYTHLMTILSSYLVLPHSLEKLSAHELSQILWYMTRLYYPRDEEQQQFTTTMTIQYSQRYLLKVFMKRLRKYTIRASAKGETLVQVTRSVSHLIGYLEKQDEELQSRQSLDEAVLPLLSIRLPGEDENDTTLFPLSIEEERDCISSNMQQQPQTNNDKSIIEIPTKVLHEEAVTMFHTLINEIVHPPFYSRNNKKKTLSSNNNKYHGANEEKVKLHSLSLRQIGDILEAASALCIPHEDITTAVIKILEHITTSQNSILSQCHSCKDISRVLLSLQRLRVGSGVYDNAVNSIESCVDDVNDMGQLSAHTTNNGIENHSVQLLGERFLEIVRLRKEQSKWACTAKTLTIILRSGVLMFQGNSTATKPILDAATVLILDETNNVDVDDDNLDMSSFLSSCNEFEVSNYLFAFAMAKRLNEDVFVALIDRMMDDDIIENCAPRSASRALWSCAMLLSLDDVGNANRKHEFVLRQVDLFHQLSPKLLLASSLSPTDISSAMWAMAKAEYAIDQGVFDQLSESLASDDVLTRSSTRFVSQALWACGKMVEFEDFTSLTAVSYDQEGEDVGIESDHEAPKVPYLESANRYIRFLIANEEQMTPKHISQSIWAMGRLRLANFILIEQMADIALRLSSSLNAREIANIVWGLNKLEFAKKPEVISKLVNCLISSPKLWKQCTAQEASMIMNVLGKLKRRDIEAFSVLSNILKEQLTEASTQSITNALWAHSVVNIPPPPELLGLWAQDRLNLLTVSSTTNAEGK